jgi:hypothetical protein
MTLRFAMLTAEVAHTCTATSILFSTTIVRPDVAAAVAAVMDTISRVPFVVLLP